MAKIKPTERFNMTTSPSVLTQPDATPLETNLARILRVNLAVQGQTTLRGIPGRINLQDKTTKTSIRLDISGEGISLSRTQMPSIIHVLGNFDPFKGSPPEFSIRSGWRKPFLKAKLRALLTPHLKPWPVAAAELFDRSSQTKNSDMTISILSKDTLEQHVWGQGSEKVSIIASKKTLTHLFNGLSMLIDDILKGRIQCQASMQNIALITDATIDHWLDAGV